MKINSTGNEVSQSKIEVPEAKKADSSDAQTFRQLAQPKQTEQRAQPAPQPAQQPNTPPQQPMDVGVGPADVKQILQEEIPETQGPPEPAEAVSVPEAVSVFAQADGKEAGKAIIQVANSIAAAASKMRVPVES